MPKLHFARAICAVVHRGLAGSPDDLAAYAAIAAHADWDTGELSGLGRQQLAALSGMPLARWRRALARIVDAGWVRVVTPGGGRASARYVVVAPERPTAPVEGSPRSLYGERRGITTIPQRDHHDPPEGSPRSPRGITTIPQGDHHDPPSSLYESDPSPDRVVIVNAGARGAAPGRADDDEDRGRWWEQVEPAEVEPPEPESFEVPQPAHPAHSASPAPMLVDGRRPQAGAPDERLGECIERWRQSRSGRGGLAVPPSVVRQLERVAGEVGIEALREAFERTERQHPQDYSLAYVEKVARAVAGGTGERETGITPWRGPPMSEERKAELDRLADEMGI